MSHVDLASTGEEKTVCVYSGGSLIWSAHADTVHVGWNGVYLYHGRDGDYLLLWRPYGCTGEYEFTYSVFSLSGSGVENIQITKDLIFEESEVEKNPAGYKEKINDYCNEVNNYLSKSMLLIDTDGGSVVYSINENKITRIYDPSVLFTLLEIK